MPPLQEGCVGSIPTSGTSTISAFLYGLWDCKGWSSVLQTEYQMGSIPIRSTVDLGNGESYEQE